MNQVFIEKSLACGKISEGEKGLLNKYLIGLFEYGDKKEIKPMLALNKL